MKHLLLIKKRDRNADFIRGNNFDIRGFKGAFMLLHGELTGKIIEAFYAVYNQLGYGFLEKVYENALAYELHRRGFTVEQQVPIEVRYQNRVVGNYFADLLIERCIIIEIKAVEKLCEEHSIQLLNYLKATDIEVGLLLSFGPKPETKRKVFQNARQSN